MNCEAFHDQLLELLSGRLESTRAKAMLEHSTQCPDCDAVLSMEESLQVDRTEGVIDNVPDFWVASMWPAVRTEIGAWRAPASAPRATPMWGWVRVVMASLLAVLLIGTGYVLGQRSTAGDEATSTSIVARVNETLDRPTSAELTSADFLAALDRLPDETTLISSEEALELLRESLRLRRWASTVRTSLDLSDGVQVGEMRAVLDDLSQDGSTMLPASLNVPELRRWLRRRA